MAAVAGGPSLDSTPHYAQIKKEGTQQSRCLLPNLSAETNQFLKLCVF
jgi:hypothetical protein